MNINNKQNILTYLKILNAFLLFTKPVKALYNILPPSIGPKGSKLNNPTPTLIKYNQYNKSLVQVNAENKDLG